MYIYRFREYSKNIKSVNFNNQIQNRDHDKIIVDLCILRCQRYVPSHVKFNSTSYKTVMNLIKKCNSQKCCPA